MPVKRRISKEREHRITPEAVAAWRKGLEIIDAGLEDTWENEGGRREEYFECSRVLSRELGIKLWEPSPFAIGDEPPVETDGTAYQEAWPKINAIREELIAAAPKERKR